jgi:hypothetical protein
VSANPSPPDDKKSAEHPVLAQLYQDLAAAQAGRDLRIEEAKADLEKLNEQRHQVSEQLDQAQADGDDEQAGKLEDQLAEFDEIEIVLRRSLGPERGADDRRRAPARLGRYGRPDS